MKMINWSHLRRSSASTGISVDMNWQSKARISQQEGLHITAQIFIIKLKLKKRKRRDGGDYQEMNHELTGRCMTGIWWL